jgi:hypothetical protein
MIRTKLLLSGALLAACAPTQPEPDPLEVPVSYTFESRFSPGESSVTYSGQAARHTMIAEVLGFADRIADDDAPVAADIVDGFNYFYDYANQGGTGADPITLVIDNGALLQEDLVDIGSVVSLRDKMPENDASFDGTVVGYPGDLTPDGVVQSLFAEAAALVVDRSLNGPLESPQGAQIASHLVTADGRDLEQLLQKFLTGAVAFSQATDDYLDDDAEGKGLLSDHTGPVVKDGVDKPYTALEHAWDEAFGYFGASRAYADFTDDEIAAKGGRDGYADGHHDDDGDGLIDLNSEINRGHSVNAAKRDRGAESGIDLSGDAIEAFLAGRHLIATTEGPLSDAKLDELRDHRDAALGAWEKALAATAAHYVNELEADYAALEPGEGYDFEAQAKHWSELKGFALVLQFNPRSPLSASDLQRLHQKIGDAPMTSADGLEQARADLVDMRDILQSTYGFADEDMAAW